MQGIADVLRLRYDRVDSKVPTDIWNRLCSRLRVVSVCRLPQIASEHRLSNSQVLSSLSRRRAGILSRCQWHDLMPEYDHTNSLDGLMDLVCQLPCALALYDRESEDFATADNPATTPLLGILAQLYEWQAALRNQECPLYTVVPAQLRNPSDDAYATRLFPFAIVFRSLQVGTYCVLSWAIQLLIYTSLLKEDSNSEKKLRSLAFASIEDHEKQSALLDAFTALPSETIKAEADRIARLVCQVVEYCNRMEMGIFGPQVMLFTRWAMRSYFRQVSAERELSWCLNIPRMYGLPTRCGIRLMSFQEE